jgi:hypothetical protein
LFFFFCLYFSLSLGGDEIESRYTHAVAMTPPQSCIIMRNARHPAILYLAKVVGCMLFIFYLSIGHDLILSSLVLITIQLSPTLLRTALGFIDADANEMRSSPSCQFIVVPRRPRLFYFFSRKRKEKWTRNRRSGEFCLFLFSNQKMKNEIRIMSLFTA